MIFSLLFDHFNHYEHSCNCLYALRTGLDHTSNMIHSHGGILQSEKVVVDQWSTVLLSFAAALYTLNRLSISSPLLVCICVFVLIFEGVGEKAKKTESNE